MTTEQSEGGKSKTFWYWRIGIMVLALIVIVISSHFPPTPDEYVSGLCRKLSWPPSSPFRQGKHFWAGGRTAHGNIIVEQPLGFGDAAYGRAQLTADTWKKTPGIEAAASWPRVSFRVSQAALLDRGKEPARVIRAVSGNRMGLWIFGQSGKHRQSDIFVAHPGGNSQTTFQTTFIWKEGAIAVLNVLLIKNNKAEDFLFHLGNDKPVCRVISSR